MSSKKEKQKKVGICGSVSSVKDIPCCDYRPPTITHLKVKFTDVNKIKVQINGKGKWIPAKYYPETRIIQFLA